MSEQDKSQKTEEPTEKKLRDARRKGDVPQSRETGTALVVFSLLMITVFLLPGAARGVSETLGTLIEQSGRIGVASDSAGLVEIGAVMTEVARGLATAVAPIFGLMIAAALVGVLIQGETVISLERIKPKVSKIDPGKGLKRLVSTEALVEFTKNMAKVLAIGGISYWVIRDLAGGLVQAQSFVPETLGATVLAAVRRILVATTVLLIPIAVADILWKRSQWKKKQMMSLKEVRDETKDSEGDPQIRARRAELRQARARQRMAQAIPTATVVLTNPTHYAVALRYESETDAAPVCVAKGTDLMAARIRELARDAEVPIIENRPLARALHAAVEVDDAVPVEHWQAVAEIVGFVMGLKRDPRIAAPKGSSLRAD